MAEADLEAGIEMPLVTCTCGSKCACESTARRITVPVEMVDAVPDPIKYSAPKVSEVPRGYPMLARFMSSAEDFYVFREFRYLQSRVLLHMQDELRALELKLYKMDEADKVERATLLMSREADDFHRGQRKALIERIRERLAAYGQLMLVSSKLAALEKPTPDDYNSILGFFNSHQPLLTHERYIENREDMVTLKPSRDNAWLDRLILKLLVRLRSAPLRYLFSHKYYSDTLEEYNGAVYSIAKIYILKMIILAGVMTTLFSAPLYPLYVWCQGTIDGATMAKIMMLQCLCTFTLGVVLNVCTRARRHEVFSACAGYMAILVVFMGQSSHSS